MKISDSELDYINKQLIDFYGIDTDTGRPIWRVSYADDEYEIRYGTWRDITPEGILLREVTEARQVKKYPWLENRYVLEQLVIVPIADQRTLPSQRLSYEPLWIFEDKQLNYLPPRLDACKFIIDTVNAAKGKGNLAKYKDSTERLLTEQDARQRVIHEQLFGDETNISDALSSGEAVTVPNNYETEH